jgi:hypothetical protein
VHKNTPKPINSIAKPPINTAYKSATEILSSLLSKKSSNQLKPQAIAMAANKHRTARNAIGCKLATHPKSEKAMHRR